jgi:hypothetical protein
MLPAQQCFESAYRARIQPNHRLVMNAKLPRRERRPQISFQPQAPFRTCMHRFVEYLAA